MEFNYPKIQHDPITDLGYFSSSGSLSPSSSSDSGCFSPPVSCWGIGRQRENMAFECCPAKKPRLAFPADPKSSRSKNPGKKRQSASEREKLRMRDLTKALHHLQNFLPPSVAPVGQTLTKIETLRFTISYISHLSALLEQTSNEETCHTQELTQHGLFSENWFLDGQGGHFQYCPELTGFVNPSQMENSQYLTFPCSTHSGQ